MGIDDGVGLRRARGGDLPRVEYLQVVAGGVVDRAREQSAADAAKAAKASTSWTTGWRDDESGLVGLPAVGAGTIMSGAACPEGASPGAVDDGYRNTVESCGRGC